MNKDLGVCVESSALEKHLEALFGATGLSSDLAKDWAAALVWANLRGVDSHGVIRVPQYIEWLKNGTINPKPTLRVQQRSMAVTVLDCDLAPGPVAMSRAMTEAVSCAERTGVGWCVARNFSHPGAIGYFALQAAEKGVVGIAMSASSPIMAYHGSIAAGVSSNPLAIAFPLKGRRPYLLDMSTATAAMGKIISAREEGRPIPSDWGIDARGQPTVDPSKVKALTPLGGAKGANLSFMIELVCSVVANNPILAVALNNGGRLAKPFYNGAAIALDLSVFPEVEEIEKHAAELGRALLNLPPSDPETPIYLPGERGDQLLSTRLRTGIPMAAATWERLLRTSQQLGVQMPPVL